MSGGIYKITNKINERFYIGKTINFEARWYHHKTTLNLGIHGNLLLQEDWNKFGADSFDFSILEVIKKREDITERERQIIGENFDRGNKCYNLTRSPGRAYKKPPSSADRARRRREGLNEVARFLGYSSWSRVETAVIHDEISIEWMCEKLGITLPINRDK